MGTDGKAVSLWCDWTVQAKGGSWERGRSRRWACTVDRAENLGSHCEHEKGVSFSFLGPLRQMNTVGPKQSVIRKRGWEEKETGNREAGSAGRGRIELHARGQDHCTYQQRKWFQHYGGPL